MTCFLIETKAADDLFSCGTGECPLNKIISTARADETAPIE